MITNTNALRAAISRNYKPAAARMMTNTNALREPLTGTVTNQAKTMLRKIFQSTASLERTQPTATTAPTLQWVVDTGSPTLEAIRTVIALINSIVNPLNKSKLVKVAKINNITYEVYPLKG